MIRRSEIADESFALHQRMEAYARARAESCPDEVVTHDKRIRSHWEPFLHSLDELGIREFLRRWEEAKELIRENGVTYNVYGDPRGMDRPWKLDPIPLVISTQEAERLDHGLIQRARLLDAVLADLYSSQHLLRDRVIPPELVFEHPRFLRPCHGITLPGSRYLHLYAADLGRGADGEFRVISDRTQAPSGAGYALENRLVMNRVLPEAFRECRVQRLALFFRTLRETLKALASRNRENPRIVLLTPGPYNETYFEHAYLARYLGYTLVEGADLTVRDQRVFLKVLGGLQPVDVIFRRLDDDFCDPLELRGDSFLGVPGLVQAVRSGNVAIANALGSGLVESPAFAAFLPAVCKYLFGEELRLGSAESWWCGDPKGLSHVLAHFDRLVIKSVLRIGRHGPIFPTKLDAKQRSELLDKIKARPREYVGQEQLPLSTVPVMIDDHLEPRHLVTRAFLAAKTDGSYTAMPGGLTRMTAGSDTLIVSMQQGGGSKDTWVLAGGPVSTFSLLSSAVLPVEISRGGHDLPSRAADNLFWLGRYVERSEGMVRLLRGILVRLTERYSSDSPELPFLLRALTNQTKTYPGFVGAGAEGRLAAPEREVLSLVFDENRLGSLASCLENLHRVAGTTRDRISNDMWRILNDLQFREILGLDDRSGTAYLAEMLDGPDAETLPLLSDALDHLNRAIVILSGFGGLAMDSMTRGQAWRFLDMGRRLERAMHTSSMLGSTLIPAPANEVPILEAVLEIADSVMTYRRRYLSTLQSAPVLDLLLADEGNPRSLGFQLALLSDHIDNLPRDTTGSGRSPEQKVILGALTSIRLADVEQLAQPNGLGTRPRLEELLSRLDSDLPILSDTITRKFLNHLLPSRHLMGPLGR